ncbi:hypothetical protein [Micromonospora sp. CA-248212]|uniref:hypothetical protein n=1 Tax=Micromonospora sp. CA-248212 TaxID=3239961 RepID=UPI003D8A69A7
MTVDPTAAAKNRKRAQQEPSEPAQRERPQRVVEPRASGPGMPPSVQPPSVRVILALIGIDLMLMGFCVVLALIDQPTLAGAAGTAALVVAGDIVRRFLNYLGRDDHQPPAGSSPPSLPTSPADPLRHEPDSDMNRSS